MPALSTVLLLASSIILTGYLFFLRQRKQFTGNLGPRETSPVKGTPGDPIVVTGFFTPVGRLAGSVSPFTNKVETYLRFAGLPFKVQDGGFAGAPKGRVGPACAAHISKTCDRIQSAQQAAAMFLAQLDLQLPWMKHGLDVVADSRFIIKYLQNTYGSQLKVQEPQDATSQAISTLIQRTCEEHMYFTSQYHRMINPKVPIPS